ncbi:MAG TPA: c-type cytochrome [Nitrospiria bacterium]|nr:c-type cytochrome [Candidatus Manganitrophaceae bacterium]HIL35494.1 c-type cytochrome [Candidatus Manganitrophaceae bacterium]
MEENAWEGNQMNGLPFRKVFFSISLVVQIILLSKAVLALDKTDGVDDSGKILVEKIGCLNCHAIDGKGGTVAPDLSHAHERLHEEWLIRFLKNLTPFAPWAISLTVAYRCRICVLRSKKQQKFPTISRH